MTTKYSRAANTGRQVRGLPLKYQPQRRPTPTLQQAEALIGFLQARLIETFADVPADGRLRHGKVFTAMDGFIARFRVASALATNAPHGLEQAWCLVAATLAVEAQSLACLWSDHPEFKSGWAL